MPDRLYPKSAEIYSGTGTDAYISTAAQTLALANAVELEAYTDARGKPLLFVAGSGNLPLFRSVTQMLRRPLYYGVDHFPGGEVLGHVPSGSDERNVYVMQSFGQPVNDHIMEAILMLDAVNRSGVNSITLVAPFLAYMRQDRKDRSGVSISARVIADLLTMYGVNRVITCDLHAKQEQGFFNLPVDELFASWVLLPELHKVVETMREEGVETELAGPDAGSMHRVLSWARRIHRKEKAVTFQKERDVHTGKTRITGFQGEVRNKHIALVDDLYAGGGTLDACAAFSLEQGAQSVDGVVIHGVFTGRNGLSPIEVLDQSPLRHLYVTDTIDIPEEIIRHPKVRLVSVAPLLAQAIYRNITGKQLLELVD